MAETAFLVAHGIPKDGESKVENAYSVLQHASSPAAMLLLALNQIFDTADTDTPPILHTEVDISFQQQQQSKKKRTSKITTKVGFSKS